MGFPLVAAEGDEYGHDPTFELYALTLRLWQCMERNEWLVDVLAARLAPGCGCGSGIFHLRLDPLVNGRADRLICLV